MTTAAPAQCGGAAVSSTSNNPAPALPSGTPVAARLPLVASEQEVAMTIERRLNPRVKETALGLWARWIRMSVVRRVIAALLTATAIGGTTFAACSTDSVTGPASSDAAALVPRASVVVHEQRVPITSKPYENPCTPDNIIAFSGYMHTRLTATADQNGGVHLGVEINETNLTGVGLVTGKVYHASNELHQVTNDRGEAPLTVTVVDHFRITGPGPNDNFFMYLMTHVTFNANGVPTADVENGETECR